MSLLALVITNIVIGVLLWLVNTYIPMEAWMKRVLNAVIAICVVLWLLSVFGLPGTANNVRVPQLH